jgi:hypothetical protein
MQLVINFVELVLWLEILGNWQTVSELLSAFLLF